MNRFCNQSSVILRGVGLFSVFLVSISSFSQVDNSKLEQQFALNAKNGSGLYFNLYNFNYQRNYEYFNRIADGLTYYGLQLNPQLVYYSGKNFSAAGGVSIKKDFGDDGIRDVQPIFTIKYRKNDWTLINGTIEGNVSHRYIEPLYNYDRMITRPLEYGTQFITDSRFFYLDAWINWERMIYKPSPVQEEIAGGIASSLTLINNQKWKVELPLQFVAYHQGGQIDTIPDPLKTFLNTASGIKLQRSYSGFVRSISTENYYLTWKDFSFQKRQPYLQGNGLLLNAGVDTKLFNLVVSYWQGNGYQSVHGAPVYQSVSRHIAYPGYIEETRQLLFFRLINRFELTSNLYLDLRLEPYLDLNHPKLEFSNSLFLVYKQDFLLKRVD